MPSLSRDLRNQLARVTLEAREVAERACRAALENLAVHEKEYRGHMSVEQRQLRNRLRARGRALGDERDATKQTQGIKRLTEDAAYEQWHRLLFTRFLVENHLLNTDDEQGNVPVTMEDCEELAPELNAKDGFDLACRFASRTLPSVFRSDDPIFDLPIAQRDHVEMRRILDSLPSEIFTASDSLGWTYQFWQAQRKDEVNAAGNKIGADELPSVTQLFTEDYMVDFLLDNTLGAWHAGKVLAANPKLAENAHSEDELRLAVALPGCPWKYLRFIKGKDGKWTPAAGTFDGWPKSAAALRVLDPCMGSGHFVVAMFERLVALRLAEEKLIEAAAVAAVIRDNLFGLEIDPRCTQIGAFNLALAGWRRVGHCKLPAMNLACSGLAPNAKREDWLRLTEGAPHLRFQMGALYDLFEKAPVLGSLINPRADKAVTYGEALHELQPLLEKALAQETKDDTAHEMAVTARGLAKAAEILAGQFTLVATNVPYLGRGKQDEVLQDYCERVHPEAKTDLATCFVERSLDFCAVGGSSCLVTPQNWLFLGTYKKLREKFLEITNVDFVSRLGPKAFQTPMWDFNVMLIGFSRRRLTADHSFVGLDAAQEKSPAEKQVALQSANLLSVAQAEQLRNPDAAIIFGDAGRAQKRLAEYADVFQGVSTTDMPRYVAHFWELAVISGAWEAFHMSPDKTGLSGMRGVLKWEQGRGDLSKIGTAQKGLKAKGKLGVGVAVTGRLHRSWFLGTRFDGTFATIVPHNAANLLPVACFVLDDSFLSSVRELDQALSVTEASFGKAPFDLAHWQKVAAKKYPDGLPKPFSSDPTQWLFNGHPAGATPAGAGLHVAVARLVGYQWPRQTGSSFPDCPALGSDGLEKLADNDGIVCLPPLNREQPAAARLRNLLAAALGKFDERALLNAAEAKKTTLEDWLRDEFFEQHCALFHHRPFLWHIWDGRKDGFSALVNYHRLNHANLQKLTYTYLGSWINDQEAAAKADTPGAAERLLAAQELQKELAKILEGEPPYDIFVRWKPLAKQARGWNPDINDGVRLNIRPFLLAKDVGKKGAGILRSKPNIKWDKDRGKEPQRPKNEYPWFWCDSEPGTDPVGDKTFVGHRWNNVHLTLAYKGGATL